MLKRNQFWILTAIGAASVIAVVLNIALAAGNDTRQREVALRNQYIQQSIQLQGLYQQMVRSLADLSIRNKDPQLRDLLAKQGITVSVNAPGSGGTGSQAASPSGRGSGAERPR